MKARFGKAKQRGIADFLRAGRHHVAEANVDLEGQARLGERGRQRHAHAAIFILGARHFRADAAGVEFEPIVGRGLLADVLEDRDHAFGRGIALAEQIQVARAAIRNGRP